MDFIEGLQFGRANVTEGLPDASLGRRKFLQLAQVGAMAAIGIGWSGCSAGGGSATGSTGSNSDGGQTGGTTGSGGTPGGRDAPIPQPTTDVLQGDFQKTNDASAMQITLQKTTYVFFEVAAQYAVQAALVTAATIDAFKSGGAFQGYQIFDQKYGVHGGYVPAGVYYAAVRNSVNAANSWHAEISTIDAADPAAWQYQQTQAVTLQPGQRAWMPITIQSGQSVFINGGNSGVNTDIIPASELANFRGGGTYQRYTDFSNGSQTKGYEPHWVLSDKLAPGAYYAVAFNPTSQPQVIEHWTTQWQTISRAASIPRASLSPSTEFVAAPVNPRF